MKLLENPIPVFAKMTGIVNDDYYQDGPNGMTEASMDEVNGGMDFTEPPKAVRPLTEGAEGRKAAALRLSRKSYCCPPQVSKSCGT
ncbi:MAG: hypothetical protein IJ106_13970 [Parasporobacterium sp.]|nr:hypothetical protein [Parasporobacterium sp.]